MNYEQIEKWIVETKSTYPDDMFAYLFESLKMLLARVKDLEKKIVLKKTDEYNES